MICTECPRCDVVWDIRRSPMESWVEHREADRIPYSTEVRECPNCVGKIMLEVFSRKTRGEAE